MDALGRDFGITHLVVEGGAETNGAFLAAQIVHELRVFVAPALDGAEQVHLMFRSSTIDRLPPLFRTTMSRCSLGDIGATSDTFQAVTAESLI